MRPVRYKNMYPAGFFVLYRSVSDFTDILRSMLILYLFRNFVTFPHRHLYY